MENRECLPTLGPSDPELGLNSQPWAFPRALNGGRGHSQWHPPDWTLGIWHSGADGAEFVWLQTVVNYRENPLPQNSHLGKGQKAFPLIIKIYIVLWFDWLYPWMVMALGLGKLGFIPWIMSCILPFSFFTLSLDQELDSKQALNKSVQSMNWYSHFR